jgi:uncharacterized protein
MSDPTQSADPNVDAGQITDLAHEKYMLFTTFRRSGEAVSTPVWVVSLGDAQVGFWTSSGSGKAKRLAHTRRVTVQPCTARGAIKAGSTPIEATARLIDGVELDTIRRQVVAKYGFAAKASKPLVTLIRRLQGKQNSYGDRGVVVSLPTTMTSTSPDAQIAPATKDSEPPHPR